MEQNQIMQIGPINLFEGKLISLENAFLLFSHVVTLNTNKLVYSPYSKSTIDQRNKITDINEAFYNLKHAIELFLLSVTENFAYLKQDVINSNNVLIHYSDIMDIEKYNLLFAKFDEFEIVINKYFSNINVYGILSNANMSLLHNQINEKEIILKDIDSLMKQITKTFTQLNLIYGWF